MYRQVYSKNDKFRGEGDIDRGATAIGLIMHRRADSVGDTDRGLLMHRKLMAKSQVARCRQY